MIEWFTMALMIAGLLLVSLVGLTHLFWHARPTRLASSAALAAQLRRGRPTLLYFYTNF